MPVILPSPPAPVWPLVAGAELGLPNENPYPWEGYWSPLILDLPERLPLTPYNNLVSPLFEFGMIDLSTRQFSPRISGWGVERGIRNNACIATPTGAIIVVPPSDECPIQINNEIGQSTIRFALEGITKDSAGVALGSCRVVAFETGRIEQDGVESDVGATLSDGSGNYSIPVALNTAYQLTAYKSGAPDVAGITRNDVAPSAVG